MMEFIPVNEHRQVWRFVHDGDQVYVELLPEVEAWADENGVRMAIQCDEDDGDDILVVLPDARTAILFKLRWL